MAKLTNISGNYKSIVRQVFVQQQNTRFVGKDLPTIVRQTLTNSYHIFLQLMLTPAATQHTHFGKSKNWFTTPQSVDEEREGNLQ